MIKVIGEHSIIKVKQSFLFDICCQSKGGGERQTKTIESYEADVPETFNRQNRSFISALGFYKQLKLMKRLPGTWEDAFS